MARKVDIKAEWLLAAWTLVFCLGLLAAFGWEQAGTVRTERTAQEESLQGGTSFVELNTAPAEQLQTLPGIGEVLAARIIDYREENGPFETVEEIMNVSGIGEGKFEELKYLITANGKGST